MAPAGQGTDRYHALDALRGAAMFLGVGLHAALPYSRLPVPFWPVRDLSQTNAFDFLLIAVHAFRMQVFFLLAGFFGGLLYTRYGLKRTAGHRLRRVALPLALALVTVQPAVQAVSMYAVSTRTWPGGPTVFGRPAPLSDSPATAVLDHFTGGEFLGYIVPAHLWFLWFLLLCFGLMLPLAWLADRVRAKSIGRRWDVMARRLFRSRLRWPVLAGVTWPFMLLMAAPAGPDTPLDWVPPAHLLGYYFLFFLAGWTLYRHRDLLSRFASGWPLGLAVGQLLVLPAGLALLDFSVSPHHVGLTDGTPFRVAAAGAISLYTWLTVGGLVGLFLAGLSRERAWVRWLADSSYWCYLASVPPIVLFQHLAFGWPAGPWAKFAAVTAATVAVLLVTYRFGVRYTWVGVLLNGVRAKPVRVAEAEPAILPLPAPVARRAA